MKSLISIIVLSSYVILLILPTQNCTRFCETTTCQKAAQYLLNSIDQSVKPCDDFYQHACGNFISRHQLPGDAVEFGTPDVLADNALTIIEDILTSKQGTKSVRKAQDLYQNCLKLENDVSLLKEELDKLGGWEILNRKSNTLKLEHLLSELTLRGTNTIISVDVDVSLENSDEYILEVSYGNLPVNQFPIQTQSGIQAYTKFVESIVVTLGAPNTQETITIINEIRAFCEKLEAIIPVQPEILNITKIYQIMTIDQLQERTDPTHNVFNWLTYYNDLLGSELTSSERVAVYNLNYLVEMIKAIKATNKDAVANFALLCFVYDNAWHAGGQLYDDYVTLYKGLTGTTEVASRKTSCAELANDFFGYAFAKQYVNKAFPALNIPHMKQIASLVQKTFLTGLSKTNIYDERTREIAEQKTSATKFLIGYPAWVKNDLAVAGYYNSYPSMTGQHFTNVINLKIAAVKQDLKLLHQKVDKNFFNLNPSAVVGEYDYSNNVITLPAGILQAPYYTNGQIQALDMGGVGSLIAVLLNSVVNNIGSQFDKEGKLDDYWTPFTKNAVEEDIKCITKQYNGYCTSPNHKACLNGSNDVLDHIAEAVGVFGAYNSYQAWLLTNPQEPQLPGLEQYNSEQLFFLNYAQRHCYANEPAVVVTRNGYNAQMEHKYTLIGTLANFDAFGKAFNCPVGLMNRGSESCPPF